MVVKNCQEDVQTYLVLEVYNVSDSWSFFEDVPELWQQFMTEKDCRIFLLKY